MSNIIELNNISKTFDNKKKLMSLKILISNLKKEKFIHYLDLLDLENQPY